MTPRAEERNTEMHDHDHTHHHGPHCMREHFRPFGFDPADEEPGCDCAGRGHRGHPGGPGGHGFRHFGFGGGGPGGFGFRAGRKLSSTELQLLLLHLLGEKPRHGYELIKAVEELSNGFYVPSPGVVYPALSYLEDLGDAASEVDETRKRYQLTDTGRAHLQERATEVKELLERLAWFGRGMDRVREAFGQGGEAEPEGDETPFDDRGRGVRNDVRELRAAFHALRLAVHEKRHSARGELVRIAKILARAAEEIRGGRG